MGQILDFSIPLKPRRQPGQQCSEGYGFRSRTRMAQPGSLSLDVFDGKEFLGFITFDRVHGDVVAWSADREHIVACPDVESAFATVRGMTARGRQ